ncbi:MAG: 2-oxoacid:acceptor oxidoreductase subunit alpha [Methanomicrobiales archaeon]|nr:2-oxoacid:acceptor oxidoreductase subunit alpha [Methanomicrobiales archaeon]
MKDFSVLIGGKAGEGINRAGFIIGRILARMGYRIAMYYDYPSLIRGGHNFAIIRAIPDTAVAAHHTTVDCILALDQNTVLLHGARKTRDTVVIANSDAVKDETIGVPIQTIAREEGGLPIMANAGLIGAFCGAFGISWDHAAGVLREEMPRDVEINLAIARRGFDAVPRNATLPAGKSLEMPLFTGNEAIGLGLLQAGLDAYVAYPMTPSSGILHYLAETAPETGLKVVHPESEIAVMLMAQGFAYAGSRTAVGTSGGGFCLMTEGLSMAGMSEVPVVVVLSQRPGPSTGVPTYSAQGDLGFVLSAGQGEFPRFVCAPGTVEQAFEWSGRALNLSWKYQVPSFVLVDKALSEGIYSFDDANAGRIRKEPLPAPDPARPYRRYADAPDGISALLTVPFPGSVIKVNSYAHDEDGLTTESPETIAWLTEKRMRKLPVMVREIDRPDAVVVAGNPDAATAVLAWGATSGICSEVAAMLDLRMVQPLVLSPFPQSAFSGACAGTDRIVAVEENATGQLARLAAAHGIPVDNQILRYDGRPFSIEELAGRLAEVLS